MEKTKKYFMGMYIDYIFGDLKTGTEVYNTTMRDIDVNKEFNLKNREKLNFKTNVDSNIIWEA